MSTAAATPEDLHNRFTLKIRRALTAAFFALILLTPKLLNLRRSERSWFAFRTILAACGAALVILPLSLWNGYLFAVVGLLMFIAAILLPPAKLEIDTDEKARELGASVVVNGGLFDSGSGSAKPVQLFVGPENIWALDASFRPLLVVSVSELEAATAWESDGHWALNLRWAGRVASFDYSGAFAEHFARVAESSIRSVMHPLLPVLPQQRRAANA